MLKLLITRNGDNQTAVTVGVSVEASGPECIGTTSTASITSTRQEKPYRHREQNVDIYNYIVQHQKNQMIGLANGSSGGGGNVSGGEESEPEVSRVTVGTRLNLDVAGGETIFLCGKWKHVKNSKF